MNLVLIRHTRVVAAGVCYGWCDVPLAETFEAEAATVRAALPWTPDETWTSPAARCLQLANTLGGPIVVEPRLRELHMGVWEGRRWEEFRGEESEAWALDPWRRRAPGGETAEEFWARVAQVRAELLARAKEKRIAVVTHGGVIRAWRGLAEGRSFEAMMREVVPFGSVTSAG